MKKMTKGFIIAVLAVIGLSFVACSEAKDDPPPANNSGPVTKDDTKPDPTLPALTGTVSILGFAELGQTLEASTHSLGGNGTISYQWKRGSANIGTNSDKYQVQAADVGSTITVTVTRSGYSGSVTSAPTDVVVAEAPPTPGLFYTLMGSYYSVSRGTATAANVVIPAVYEGLPVTTIGDFSGYRNMTNIRIPDRITSISASAFSNCSGLEIVTIPDSVMTIGGNAFMNCTSLEFATIPDSVMSIGSNVFTNCNNLTSITIPFIGPALNGNYHFGYLFGASSYSGQNASIPSSLKTVIITGGNSVPDNAFYGCTNLTNINIPNSVLSIGQSAFYGCSGLTSVTIGNNVTNIGQSAFYNCSSLPNIIITNKVTNIGQSAFYGCSGLTSVTIGNNVTDIGQSAFYNCSSLPNITIPNSVLSIGQSAFYGCNSLPSIIIPDSVTSIGQSAFSGCTNLTNITIPFVGTALNGTSNTHFGYIFGASSNSNQNYSIPASLKTVIITGGGINANAFYNCTELTSITIGNNVTYIYNWEDNGAFFNCSGLSSITVSSGNTVFRSEGNCIIGKESDNLILGCKTSIIPNNVTSIGYGAFYGCSGLTSVTIPNSVLSIGRYAFYGCSELTSIIIPDSVTSIGDSAFRNCTSLESITLPFIGGSKNTWRYDSVFGYIFGYITSNYYSLSNGTTYQYDSGSTSSTNRYYHYYIPASLKTVVITNTDIIPQRAFYNCTSLTSVTIPNSVTSIGASAFYGCTSLTSITIPFVGCTFYDEISYTYISYTSLFYLFTPNPNAIYPENGVPTSLKTVIITGGNSIPDSAFEGCYNLTSITIPDSVTSIGDSAFSRCSGLSSIAIPNSVTSIGQSAFYGCSRGLTSITVSSGNTVYRSEDNCLIKQTDNVLILGCKTSIIPNNVTSIGDYAFSSCSGLTSITIPNNVTSIGSSAFEDCSGLTSITIPNNVTSIGDSAFYNCTGLTSVTFLGNIPSSGFANNNTFPSDLRTKFYATNSSNGTPGTYTRPGSSDTWTKQ